MSNYGSSMQYTVGTAIERAREQGHLVELLLEGHWVSGRVVASDGHRRVDYRLVTLADRAIDALGPQVAMLWT